MKRIELANALTDFVQSNLSKTTAYCLVEQHQPKKAKVDNQLSARVLAEFDRVHAPALEREFHLLTDPAGSTHTGNNFIPASYQREVIRAALSDLNVLSLVNIAVDPTATYAANVPFEEKPRGHFPNDGVVYEGQGIPFSGVGLGNDIAYIQPMKLAMSVTNEVIHFSQNGAINWEAWGNNIIANSRVLKELVHLRVCNEMLRSSDWCFSGSVSNEPFLVSESGLIKTERFPVVRPLQVRDIKGNAIGIVECPVSILIGGLPINYFTGARNLPNGLYWRFANLNLGYIQLVDNMGNPAGFGASGMISYSEAKNLIKFDLHRPDETPYKKHLNGLIDAIGDQKSMLSSHRYSSPNYALMSSALNNEITKAEQFAISLKRDGTNTDLQGDLEAIKSLPVFDTNAPSDMGDYRILLGQKGLTTYTISKPFSIGQPFEAVNAQGEPTGVKLAYGEEYSSIHTPKVLRERYASVLVFDSSKR